MFLVSLSRHCSMVSLCFVSVTCLLGVTHNSCLKVINLFLWQKVTEEKYEIKVVYEEAAMKITTTTDPKVVVTITLTSPVMREGDDAEHGSCFMSFHENRALNKPLL